MIAVGCWILWLVISAGPDSDGVQAAMPIDWRTIWRLFLVGLGISCVGIAAALGFVRSDQKMERRLLGIVGTVLLALLAFLWFKIDVNSSNPDSMRSAVRILWQVIEAGAMALVLLAGCVLVFRKRAGIVLLHAGIGLIMANELVVHFLHKEAQMTITEGQAANYASDIRTVELAVIGSASNPAQDDVVVMPEQLLRKSLEKKQPITDGNLPFAVQTNKFCENSDLVLAKPDKKNSADTGAGRAVWAIEQRTITGEDNGERVNLPAAYVHLTDPQNDKSLGTYLVSVLLPPQKVKVGDKQYEIALCFERDYKPFTMHLDEVKADMYLGTAIPRNYESRLQLVDPSRNTDRKVAIRMNEPFRYGGETFYQSGYHRDPDTGTGTTTLQVVSNFGWMIPYVACMIVAIGMLAHFSQILIRFLRRRDEGRLSAAETGGRRRGKLHDRSILKQRTWGRIAVLPIVMVLIAGGFLAYAAIPPSSGRDEMDLYAFGKLPVEMGGRVQPIDTLARNSLRMISLRERYPDENGQYLPAVKWLLELTARPEAAESLRVVRIDNPDVLDMLGLQRRQYYRYSWAEVNQNKSDLDRARAGLEGREAAAYTTYEKKLAELDKRLSLYETLRYAFLHRPIPKRPTQAEYKADPQGTMQSLTNIKQRLESLPAFQQSLAEHHPPLAVPPLKVDGSNSQQAGQVSDDRWEPYSVAWMINYLNEIRHEPVNPATVAWEAIFDAYAKQDAQAFNQAVRSYAELMADHPPPEMNKVNPEFEAWFNHWSPFFDCQWLYFVAFCLAALAWLGWGGPLNRAAFWLIAVTFLAHTFALAARMYISGRPPVTNLYSSAIFIGWAAVLAGLILEAVYRLGFRQCVGIGSRFCHAADRRQIVASARQHTWRHDRRDAGRARYAILAGHARHLRHAGLHGHAGGRLAGIDLRGARAVHADTRRLKMGKI